MTLNALALELISAHREDSSDTDYVAVVERWIKDALEDLALETDWRAFITNTTLPTVAGTRLYTLPTLVRDVRFFRNPDTEEEIIYRTKEWLVGTGLDLEVQGRPDFWYYEDQQDVTNDFRFRVGFQPVPDAIYTFDVSYNVIPANITSGNHIPVQNNALMPLRYLTRAFMSMDDKDFDTADRFFQLYQDKVTKLYRKENRKFADYTRMVTRDVPGRGADRRYARLDPNHF